MTDNNHKRIVSTSEELKALPHGTILLEREDGHRTPDVWRLLQGAFRAVMVLAGCESSYALDDQHDVDVILKCGPFMILHLPAEPEDTK